MKDIQLTGIGNALVDLQYEVSDTELSELEFEKGTMTLVDLDKQKSVIEKFKDRFKNKMSGGSAANTVIGFAQFGGTAAYKTKLGNDELSSHYRNEFESLGIKIISDDLDDTLTGTCFIMVTPDAERTLVTSLGANTSFSSGDIDSEIIKRSEWLYFEGYKFTEEGGSEAIEKAISIAKENNTKIAVSFSDKFIVDVFRENLDKAIKYTDLIFCNEMEAKAYTAEDDSQKAFEKLKSIVPNVAMTLGKNGSLIHWEEADYEIPSYPVDAVDATGAGDMYAAGVLYGLITEKNPIIGGKLGSMAASKVVSQFGPRINLTLKDIKREVSLQEE
jgi:sugar/nucleoside kinase (ribokinase family)